MVSFFLDRLLPKQGFVPQSLTDTAVDTAAIDRTGFGSAVIKVSNAIGVDVAAGTIAVDIFEGASSSPATAVTLESAISDIDVTAAGYNYYFLDLSGMNKYFKVTVTPDLTATEGGTASVDVAVDVILCDANADPASGSAKTIYRKSA